MWKFPATTTQYPVGRMSEDQEGRRGELWQFLADSLQALHLISLQSLVYPIRCLTIGCIIMALRSWGNLTKIHFPRLDNLTY
jgi:hypothetical protein